MCVCTVIVFVHAILMHPAQVLGNNALYLSTRSFMNFTIMSVHKYCKIVNIIIIISEVSNSTLALFLPTASSSL